MRRRELLQGAGAILLIGGSAGCTAGHKPTAVVPPLPPLRASIERIIKITVCTRPFRAQGPRLEVENLGDTVLVHNYGHGGSGWSLSWGSGTIAAAKALATGAREFAVIGCGALGLTSAILLQRTGCKVTIYAKELPPEVRSSNATGSFTPDSRICLQSEATPEFKASWAEMCRTSYRAFSNLLGLPGAPVEWVEHYALTDIPFEQERAQQEAADTIKFARLRKEMTPEIAGEHEDLPAGSHPFAAPYVRRSSNMLFNLVAYQRLLLDDFRHGGGRIEVREFHEPGELRHLPQKTIVSCPGFGARTLFNDQSIIPVRGQLARLVPQPELHYGLSYRKVSMVPRRDGIVVQAEGAGAAEGYNDASTEPDRTVAQDAVRTLSGLKFRQSDES